MTDREVDEEATAMRAAIQRAVLKASRTRKPKFVVIGGDNWPGTARNRKRQTADDE